MKSDFSEKIELLEKLNKISKAIKNRGCHSSKTKKQIESFFVFLFLALLSVVFFFYKIELFSVHASGILFNVKEIVFLMFFPVLVSLYWFFLGRTPKSDWELLDDAFTSYGEPIDGAKYLIMKNSMKDRWMNNECPDVDSLSEWIFSEKIKIGVVNGAINENKNVDLPKFLQS